MEQKIIVFIKSFLAGICISLGATVFLSVENKIIGSFLFSFGLITILIYELNLFTGKIGYILDNKNYLDIVIIVIGNVFGTILYGTIIRETYVYNNISERCNSILDSKLNQSYLSLFFLAVMCGILMYIAVDEYKKSKQLILPVLCVSVFILCNFEHSIAYSAYSGIVGRYDIGRITVMILGNAVGSIFWNKFSNINK